MGVRFAALSLLGAVLLLGGCAPRAVRAAAPAAPEPIGALRREARGVTILRGDGTGPVPWDEVVDDLADADVVLMGEVHQHPLGNAVQQQLFEDVLTLNPRTVLSMEFYERDQQAALDDYLGGVTDRKGFMKAADRNANNDAPAHARLIDACREARRPVVASNAPRRYVRLARTEGFARLSQMTREQQRLFAIPLTTPKGAYRDRFVEAMGDMATHGGEGMIEGFLRSQTVWDATMAQSIVEGLDRGSPVVHVVGFFHVQFGAEPGGSGLIDQINAMAPTPLNITTLITLPAESQTLRAQDAGIADFVVYVGQEEAR